MIMIYNVYIVGSYKIGCPKMIHPISKNHIYCSENVVITI